MTGILKSEQQQRNQDMYNAYSILDKRCLATANAIKNATKYKSVVDIINGHERGNACSGTSDYKNPRTNVYLFHRA